MQPNYPPMNPGDYDSSGDEWITCPVCRSDTYLLATYELPSSSEFPAVEVDLWELILWGWVPMVGNFIIGLMTYSSRKTKLAALKHQILPRFPNSLVCPRCLAVTRRR